MTNLLDSLSPEELEALTQGAPLQGLEDLPRGNTPFGKRVLEAPASPVVNPASQRAQLRGLDAAMDAGLDFADSVDAVRQASQFVAPSPEAPSPGVNMLEGLDAEQLDTIAPPPFEPPRNLLEVDGSVDNDIARYFDIFQDSLRTQFSTSVLDAGREFGRQTRRFGDPDQERSIGEIVQRGATGFLPTGAAESVITTFRRAFDSLDDVAERVGTAIETGARETAAELEHASAERLGPLTTFGEQVAATAGGSFGASLAPLAVGFATRSPGAAAAAAGFTTYFDSLARGLDEKLSDATAERFAALDGLVEAGTELLPMRALFADTGFVKKMASFLLREVPSEMLATTLQDINEYVHIEPDTPLPVFLNKLTHDLALTAVATPISGGLQVTTVQGIQKGLEIIGQSPRRNIGDSKELTPTENAAEDFQDTLDAAPPSPGDPSPFGGRSMTDGVQALAAEMEAQALGQTEPGELAVEDPEMASMRRDLRGKVSGRLISALDADVRDTFENGPPQARIGGIFDNITDGPPPPDIEIADRTPPESMRADLDRFTTADNWFSGLVHMSRHNPHIVGLVRYLKGAFDQTLQPGGVMGFWATKTEILNKANDRLLEARPFYSFFGRENRLRHTDYNGTRVNELDAFFLEADQRSLEKGSALNDAEKQQIITDLNLELNENHLAYAENIWNDYRELLTRVQEQMERNISAQFDVDQRAAAFAELDQQFGAMRERNFYPHTRFGKYMVTVTAKRDMVLEGQEFAEGDVVYSEAFENKPRADNARKALATKFRTDQDIAVSQGITVLDDTVRMLQGLPINFSEMLIEQLQLTPEQQAAYAELRQELSPANAIRKKLVEDANIPGFAKDSRRVYADYFQRMANHMARLTHAKEMDNAIDQVRNSVDRMRAENLDWTKRAQILEWMIAHKDYLNNPGNELAELRSIGFVWHLGFMPKSALVNLSQLPFVSLPHLGAKYNDLAAGRELTRSMKSWFGQFRNGRALAPGEQRLLDVGRTLGILEESAATENGAVSEGNQLQRLVGDSPLIGPLVGNETVSQIIRDSAHYGAWMFSKAEKINREITAIAGYRLAKARGATDQEAIVSALEDVVETQFEYARWNRAKFARGKKSAFFLFWQYMTNMMWFLRDNPARWRYLGMLMAAAGLSGLPFFEDIEDFTNFAMTKIGQKLGLKDPKFVLEGEVRQFVQEINDGLGDWEAMFPDEELFFNGAGSKLSIGVPFTDFKLAGPYDISASLSMGNIIPGTEIFGGRDPDKALGQGIAQAGGAVASIPYGLYKAITSNDPDTWRVWERALPASGRSISRAARFLTRGEETDRAGNVLAEFDVRTLSGAMDIAGQAAGFAPSRIGQQRNARFRAKEAETYYTTRRTIIFERYARAFRLQDGDGMRATREDIAEFNRTVPFPEIRITGEDLMQSLQERERRRQLEGQGIARRARYRRLYTEQLETFLERDSRAP